MFDWFFNLFKFSGVKKDAKHTTKLTKKADSTMNFYQDSSVVAKREEIENKLFELVEKEMEACRSDDELISQSDIDANPDLRHYVGDKHSRTEIATYILAHSNPIGFIKSNPYASSLMSLYQRGSDQTDSIARLAVEAMVFNFMAAFDVAEHPEVLSNINRTYDPVEVGGEDVLDGYTLAELRKMPEFSDRERWTDEALGKAYSAGLRAKQDNTNAQGWAKFKGEKTDPYSREVINQVYNAVKSIDKKRKPAIQADKSLEENIFNMFKAAVPKITVLESLGREAEKVADKEVPQDKNQQDNEDKATPEETVADPNQVDPAQALENKEFADKILGRRQSVFRKLERAAGNDPSKRATINVLKNSIVDATNFVNDTDFLAGKQDTRNLNEYRVCLQLLHDAGHKVLSGEDIKNIYTKVYQETRVPDPNNKNATLSLEEVQTDCKAIAAARQALVKQKYSRNVRNAFNNLQAWYTDRNPAYHSAVAEKDQLTKNIEKIKKSLAEFEEKGKAGQLSDREVQAYTKLKQDQYDLEQRIEPLDAKIQTIVTSRRLNPVRKMIESLTKGHGGMALADTATKKSMEEYLKKLHMNYQDKLKSVSEQANKIAQEKAISSLIENHNDLRDAAKTVKFEFENKDGKLVGTGRPIAENKGFMTMLDSEFDDQLQRTVGYTNYTFFEDFLKDIDLKIPNKYNKQSPKAQTLTNQQIDKLMDNQNMSDVVQFYRWLRDESGLDASYIASMLNQAYKEAFNMDATPEKLASLIKDEGGLYNAALKDKSTRSLLLHFVDDVAETKPNALQDYEDATGKSVAYAASFNPRHASSFVENVVENDVIKPMTDSNYGLAADLEYKADQVEKAFNSFKKQTDDCANFYEKAMSASESASSDAIRQAKLRQAETWSSKLDSIAEKVSTYKEKTLTYVEDTIKKAKAAMEDQKHDYSRYTALNKAVEKAEEIVAEFKGFEPAYVQDNEVVWPKFSDAKEDPFDVAHKDRTENLVTDYKGDVFYKDGNRYLLTQYYNGEFIPTTTPYTHPVFTKKWYVPNAQTPTDTVVCDDNERIWYSLISHDEVAAPKERQLASLNGREVVYDEKGNYAADEEGKIKTKDPAYFSPIEDEPQAAPALTEEEQKAEEEKAQKAFEFKQRIEDIEKKKKDEFTDTVENPIISDEEPFVSPEDLSKHSAGFRFKGITRTALFTFKGTPNPIFKFAGSTDGIDAFTSPEEVQKTIEQPFGTAMTPQEEAIKKQRSMSPDNTSQMGQTSIQQDQEANKSFSSKQITKALKAAYDKDPNLFQELVKIIANTGSTGTFCSAIVALLPKVNWVNEAAIREYNKTAVEPVHRNSFQHALEKAMEEQLKKHEEFVKICGQILKGEPVK